MVWFLITTQSPSHTIPTPGPIRAFDGPDAALNIAERFLKHVVCKLPHCQQQLQLMVFAGQLSETSASALADVNALVDACEEVSVQALAMIG